jgi:hypothetical protein
MCRPPFGIVNFSDAKILQINAVQFLAYLFFGPETRYMRVDVPDTRSVFQQKYLTFKRLDPAPFRLFEFIQPIFLAKYMTILIPTVAYVCYDHPFPHEYLLTKLDHRFRLHLRLSNRRNPANIPPKIQF